MENSNKYKLQNNKEEIIKSNKEEIRVSYIPDNTINKQDDELKNYRAYVKLLYMVFEGCKLIPQNAFSKYFNPKGIKFPTELFSKIHYAQKESIDECFDKTDYIYIKQSVSKMLNEVKEYRELRQHYIAKLIENLKNIKK